MEASVNVYLGEGEYEFSVWVRDNDSIINTAAPVIAEFKLLASASSPYTSVSTNTRLSANSTYLKDTYGGWKRYARTLTITKTSNRYFSFRLAFYSKANTAGLISFASASLKTNSLLATGIDIKKKTITLTSDNLICQNNSGENTMWLDNNGNLGTSGNIFTGMTLIENDTKFEQYFTAVGYDSINDWDETTDSYVNVLGKSTHRIVTPGDAYMIHNGIGRFLIPDMLQLSDIVYIHGVLSSGNADTQFLLPFALPRSYSTGYITDIVRTQTKYKNGTPHLINEAELYMLVGSEFTFMTNMAGEINNYFFVLPRIKSGIANGETYWEWDNTGNGRLTYNFGTTPVLTIRYERLRFRIEKSTNSYLYTDGIVPVLKQEGSGFLYNNMYKFE